MSRCLALVLLTLLLAVAQPAGACRVIRPNLQDTTGYSAVFVGRVTAIHLVGYERSLLGVADIELEGEPVSITDGSSEVTVIAVPIQLVSGSASGSLSIRLVGCTTTLPALRERGVFFLSQDRASAVTVWESSEQEFAETLNAIGVSGDAF